MYGRKTASLLLKCGRAMLKGLMLLLFGMISGRKRTGRFKMPRAWFFGLNQQEVDHLRFIQYCNFQRFMKKYKSLFRSV